MQRAKKPQRQRETGVSAACRQTACGRVALNRERATEPPDPGGSDGQRGGVTRLCFWLTIYNLRLEMAWIINVTLTAETHREEGREWDSEVEGKKWGAKGEKKQKEGDEDGKRRDGDNVL